MGLIPDLGIFRLENWIELGQAFALNQAELLWHLLLMHKAPSLD